MRRTQVAIFLHCVWGTWDREPLLTERVERAVYRAIEAKCQELGVEVVAIGGDVDHVHLLIQMPATRTVAEVIQGVKGASAHLVNHQLPSDNLFKWQGAYAAFSVSLNDREQVRNYILKQKEHHAMNRLIDEWELAHDDAPKI